jgi:hypothetical protein
MYVLFLPMTGVAAGVMRKKAKRAGLDQTCHFQVFFGFY